MAQQRQVQAAGAYLRQEERAPVGPEISEAGLRPGGCVIKTGEFGRSGPAPPPPPPPLPLPPPTVCRRRDWLIPLVGGAFKRWGSSRQTRLGPSLSLADPPYLSGPGFGVGRGRGGEEAGLRALPVL